MIQFNLLPAVKVDYIKARRMKRLVIFGSAGAIAASLVILFILFSIVFIGQNIRLKNLDKSIKKETADIKGRPDINKVLTIQNQLTSIDALHVAKPETGRLFTYVTQVVPSKVTIQSYSLNFAEPNMVFTGQAPTLEEVNKFVDTLKFTTISKNAEDTSNAKAFSQVVLSTFSRDIKGVTFTISLVYDPSIFASEEKDLKLVIPKITTTRSATERPEALFQQNTIPATEGASQ